MAVEHDEVSGQNTTGHEWDGIKELDTPIPKPAIW
ncbi:MAG: cbb3-type cytochrome c oxidase N-terminal domain-containing protein, partial [Geminicoccaceae bacterium]